MKFFVFKIKFGLLISIFLILFGSNSISGVIWPEWLDISNDIESLGQLCASENDTIGRKLGCDCKYPVTSPGLNLYADCSGQTLGTINSRLPLKINVSRHVRRLILSDNFIEELTGESFGSVDGVYEANFARNRIRNVVGLNFSRLGYLDLSHNQIQNLTVDAFKNSRRIESLDLSFNALSFIEFETFSQLEYLRMLNLASNNIGFAVELYDAYPFKLENLDRLEDIDLSNNSLQEFPSNILDGSHHIKKLNLKNNKILHIPTGTFLMLENLEILDLSGNLFNILHANAFHGLVSLEMLIFDGNNELVLIEENAFAGLPSLKELSCQRNHRLTGIHINAFKADGTLDKNDSRPTTVRLGDNALTSIEADLLEWKDLEYLDLVRNPWICDCNIQWVAELREQKPTEAAILIDPDFKCDSPAPLRGSPVATIDSGELMCYSETASVIGLLGIVLFCIVLVTFCTVIGLNAFGMMPESFRRLNIFGHVHSLPKYMRVRPKPGNAGTNEPPPELEWDNGDIGR